MGEVTCVGGVASAEGSGLDVGQVLALDGGSDLSWLVPAGEQKPFLGGYRDKKTHVEYHHASSQTDRLLGAVRLSQQAAAVSCSTQTVQLVSSAVQSVAHAGTQVPRPGWFQDMSDCRTLEPAGELLVLGKRCRCYPSFGQSTFNSPSFSFRRPASLPAAADHQTAEEWLVVRRRAAQTVQCWWRGCLGRRLVALVRRDREAGLAAAAAGEAAARAQAEAAAQHEVRRRLQPRRPSDFALLYEELAAWWGQETAKIKAQEGVSEEAKQEGLQALLAKETRLLQTIDKLKIKAAPPNRAERVGRMLVQLAAPKWWPAYGGGTMEVVTADTARAAELAAAYHALLAWERQGLDARLAALLAVKFLVKAVDCSKSREIVGLVDREADLINRGRSPASMGALRQRVANRFLELIQDPAFNPAAAALLQARAAPDNPALQDWPLVPRAAGAWEHEQPVLVHAGN